MKVNVSIRTIALSVVLFVGSLTVSAHNNDGNLIYNSEERDGVMVEQTVYKKEGAALANYMKYNYKYNDQKRMTESEALNGMLTTKNGKIACASLILTKVKL